jgi:hypothetical protein
MLSANAPAPRTAAAARTGLGLARRCCLKSEPPTRTAWTCTRIEPGKSAQTTHAPTNGPPEGNVVAITTADAAAPTIASPKARARTVSGSAKPIAALTRRTCGAAVAGEAQIKGVAALASNDVWFVGELWNPGLLPTRPGLRERRLAVDLAMDGDEVEDRVRRADADALERELPLDADIGRERFEPAAA